MLIPRRVKHRKQHHPSRSGATKGGSAVAFGDDLLVAQQPRLWIRPEHLFKLPLMSGLKTFHRVCLLTSMLSGEVLQVMES